MEAGPAADFAFYPHSPAHHPDQPCRDTESQSGSAVFPRRRTVRLRKWIKDMFLLLRRNSDPGVGNYDLQNEILPVRCCNLNVQCHLTFPRKLDGIAHQVGYDLAQTAGISPYYFGHFWVDLTQELQPLLVGSKRERLER